VAEKTGLAKGRWGPLQSFHGEDDDEKEKDERENP
jgi:hypothetical protein